MGQRNPTEFGKYRLLRKFAQGGMAEIFLAQDDRGQICALKRILPHLAHEEGFIRMFLDEARIVENLNHENIARVYEHGKHDGFYYIALEYVEGHSLLSMSERAAQMRIPLPRGLLSFAIAELLAGLAHAHSARNPKGQHLGIVHRDVTPQNVMISYDGTVKLIDFGVAKARQRLTQTEAGFTKGKLAYMSPEQARGEELDGRSDLFSVGIVLFEITTGTRLFNKEGPGGILGAIVNDPIPRPSSKVKGFPAELEQIILKALAKDADRRWQTADEMSEALRRFAQTEKPKANRGRLANLVQDLFGEHANRKIIEAARLSPNSVSMPGDLVREESVRVRGSRVAIPDFETPEQVEALREVAPADGDDEPRALSTRTSGPPPGEDTRMMEAPSDQHRSRVSQLSRAAQLPRASQMSRSYGASGLIFNPGATGADLPALSTPLALEDVPVPEPRLPLRVRFARGLTVAAAWLRVSVQVHRWRYVGGAFAALFFVLLGMAQVFGATGSVKRWFGGAVTTVRDIRQEAGLERTATTPDAALPPPTSLKLVTEPPGASVGIDGLGAGCVTPCELSDVRLGKKLSIDFTLTGYRAHNEKVTLRPNEGVKEIAVELEREMGSLVIATEPPGASVYVEGVALKGQTPLTLDGIRAGVPVHVEIKKPGFRTVARDLTVTDRQNRREVFTLDINPEAIPPGRVEVVSNPSGCAVKVDGQSSGTTPMVGALKTGRHTIDVRCEYYAPDTREVHVRPNERTKVEFEPIPSVFGYLTLRATPERGTVIKIDGRTLKPPVEFFKVIPGNHGVEIVNEDLDRRRALTVFVEPDKRVTREVNLLK